VHISPALRLLGSYVIFTLVAVTVFTSPWNSLDPVNLPKLMVLGIFSTIAFILALINRDFLKDPGSRLLQMLLGFFVLQLFLVLLLSPGDLAFNLYGTPGRNTGFFAYLFLASLLFASASCASAYTLKKVLYSLFILGGFLGLYGLAQSQGLDFFKYVNDYPSNVFGTFGNPNFHSAFMGIVAAAALTMTIFGQMNWTLRISLFSLFVLAILNVYLSSEQGYLNFLAGFIAALLLYLFSKGNSLLAWSSLLLSCMGGLLTVAGVFNRGPLADLLFGPSLQARGFYWQAGMNMIIEKPIFGIGFDGFGDWYRRSRSELSAMPGFNSTSNSAHNIPLDIGSSGGIPLLILYLLILVLAFKAMIKVVKRAQDLDPFFASIVAAWVAYQTQSLISINQLGLGVWGWSLSGLLIGYELNTRVESSKRKIKVHKNASIVNEHVSASTLLIVVAAAAIGSAVSLPPYLAANKFYNAIKSGNAQIIIESAYLRPYDRNRFLVVAQILSDNNLQDEATKILRSGSKLYPDSYDVWIKWYGLARVNPQDLQEIELNLRRLEPRDLDLRKGLVP
jgi:O-antigen ligase